MARASQGPLRNMDTVHGAGLLRRLDQLIAARRTMLDAVFEMSGVSGLQYLVLAAVARAQEGASGAWIARQCGISRQATHHVLRRLEGRELVTRQSIRRLRSMSVRYVAAPWGTSRLEICSGALASIQRKVAEHFTADEIETLCRLMGTLALALRESAAQID